jgi:hypothetical protein
MQGISAMPSRIGIQIGQLFVGVGATLIAKVRLVIELVGVLGVEHDHVVAEQGQRAQPGLDVLWQHDGVARTIQHHAQGIKGVLLFCHLAALGAIAQQRTHGTQREGKVAVFDGGRRIVARNARAVQLGLVLERQSQRVLSRGAFDDPWVGASQAPQGSYEGSRKPRRLPR